MTADKLVALADKLMAMHAEPHGGRVPARILRDTATDLRALAQSAASGWVAVPRAKLNKWAWSLERNLRRGHKCDVSREAEGVCQSISAVLAAGRDGVGGGSLLMEFVRNAPRTDRDHDEPESPL